MKRKLIWILPAIILVAAAYARTLRANPRIRAACEQQRAVGHVRRVERQPSYDPGRHLAVEAEDAGSFRPVRAI
jgi:hypothetical protein